MDYFPTVMGAVVACILLFAISMVLSKYISTKSKSRSKRDYPGIDSTLEITSKIRSGLGSPLYDSYKATRRNGSVTDPNSTNRLDDLNTILLIANANSYESSHKSHGHSENSHHVNDSGLHHSHHSQHDHSSVGCDGSGGHDSGGGSDSGCFSGSD
ncbi:hypothetical protein M2444_004604 [Paenibacillus sp. PastF-3]|uniref:hypothetical protein n=1 Tax=Paenibacillus sp. PastF-3 TaxID=2940626 RepID=UPI00247351EE|nr:hypothetical protein [Paenibacillus sp. PastF-3]MDH6372775.1 hypothetical protein [Paenibacillus sp. PastF-3]